MQLFLYRIFRNIFRLTASLSVLMIVGLIIAASQKSDETVIISLAIATLVLIVFALISRKISWYFSAEGRRHRHLTKFEDSKKEIESRWQQKRDRFSRKADLKNMRGIIKVTKKEISYRR